MFDIVAFVREKIFRRPRLQGDRVAGEDLSEKRTTGAGYFLLFCMFIAIISTAQWTIGIISDIPTRPDSIPYCVSNLADAFAEGNTTYYYDGYISDNCVLTSEKPKFDFTQEFQVLLPVYKTLQSRYQSLQSLKSQQNSLDQNAAREQEEYNTALTEKMANERSDLYDTSRSRDSIRNTRNEMQNTDAKIAAIETEIAGIKSQNKQTVQALGVKLDQAEHDYSIANILYRLYVALLALLFSGVVFAVLYTMYVRKKIINSPNAIIFSVATFAYGLILLQIILMFLWDIIPHKLMTIIVEFLSSFKPMLYIVQFLWPVLIVAIFGYLVYRIQKRLYSKQNILKRFVSDKKCPQCGNGVDVTKPFCPLCACEIQTRCLGCHEYTLKGMPFCSNCGKTL